MNARQTTTGGLCLSTANAELRRDAIFLPKLDEVVRRHRVQGRALVQAAATTIPHQERINWGHAEQMHDALKYAVYAAFALGVVNEDEARDLGFPV